MIYRSLSLFLFENLHVYNYVYLDSTGLSETRLYFLIPVYNFGTQNVTRDI